MPGPFITPAKTDACGRFCVWIPRWDIDWVLRFRRERRCFPIIFERPNLRDLLDKLIPGRVYYFEAGSAGDVAGEDVEPLLRTTRFARG